MVDKSEKSEEKESRLGADEEYLTIIIDKELKEKAREKADAEERNLSSLVRYLIKQYVGEDTNE